MSVLQDDDVGRDIITSNDPQVPNDESNLIIKALNAFRRETGHDKYFKIILEKIIPMEAGLGGGSGNAATALYGANKLLRSEIPTTSFINWSASVGTDVPVFHSLGTALCTGRGNTITPIAQLENLPDRIYVIKPDIGLSTPQVYRALDLTKCSTKTPQECFLTFVGGSDNLALVNDLEAPAFELAPKIGSMKEALIKSNLFGGGVLMSGSGSSLFALETNNLDKNNVDKDRRRAFWNQFLKDWKGTKVYRCAPVRRLSTDRWYPSQNKHKEIL